MQFLSYRGHKLGTVLLAVAMFTLVDGCDQPAPTPLPKAAGAVIRFIPQYADEQLAGLDIQQVSATSDNLTITHLTVMTTSDQIYPIFAYGHGKLARYILPPAYVAFRAGRAANSADQIEVVDVSNGAATIYPAEGKPQAKYETLFYTPFSPDGQQVLVPSFDDTYYLLNLETKQLALIPNLDAFEIIGWSPADNLIYAFNINRSYAVEQGVCDSPLRHQA